MSEVFYQSGSWSVTSDWVRTHRHDFAVKSITAIEVSRFPLVASVAIAAGLFGLTYALSPVVYPHEKMALAILCIAGITASSQVGWVHLRAADWRGTETGKVWGPMWRLKAMREAIHQAQSSLPQTFILDEEADDGPAQSFRSA